MRGVSARYYQHTLSAKVVCGIRRGIVNEMFAHVLEMMDRVSFGGEVSEIEFARRPTEYEVALLDAVLNPMIAHGDSLGTTDFRCGVGDCSGCCIVEGDCCRELKVTEVVKGLSYHFAVAGVEVKTCIFGFSGCRDYGGYDGAGDEYGSVNVGREVRAVVGDGAECEESGEA